MSDWELFWFIFTDTLLSNLIVSFRSELAAWAAPKLSELSEFKIYSATFLAVMLASGINYFFGIIFEKFIKAISTRTSKKTNNIGVFKSFYNNYGLYLLFLGFIPVYSKLLAMFAGFARYNFLITIFMIGALKTCYYVYFR